MAVVLVLPVFFFLLSPVQCLPPTSQLPQNHDLDALICRYFWEGHSYKIIMYLLALYHGIRVSERTLYRKLKQLNLRRRHSLTLGSARSAVDAMLVSNSDYLLQYHIPGMT